MQEKKNWMGRGEEGEERKREKRVSWGRERGRESTNTEVLEERVNQKGGNHHE